MSRKRVFHIFSFLILLGIGVYLLLDDLSSLKGKPDLIDRLYRESLLLWPNILLAFIIYISTLFIRAWRIQVVLNEKKMIWVGVCSASFSYVINLFVSRVGEVLRVVNYRKFTKASYGQLASVIFIDRLMDVISLVSILLIALSFRAEELKTHFKEFSQFLPTTLGSLGVCLILISLLALFGEKLALWISRLTFIPEKLRFSLSGFTEKCGQSFKACASFKSLFALSFSSAYIWIGYFFIFNILVTGFSDFKGSLDWMDSFFIFTCGSVGMALPVPGGLGTYHKFTSEGMMIVTDITKDSAAGITTFVYLIQIWLLTLIFGSFCYFTQFILPKPSSSENE